MLLTIDIGNTSITLGVFRKKSLIRRFSIPTKPARYGIFLTKLFSGFKITDVIISSVVPEATKALAKDIKILLGKKPLILGSNIMVPIVNKYLYPKQVGQDRLVNAFASTRLYSSPAIVVDFGTAITFDVISKKGEYLGGMIIPGLMISLEALKEKTALLPKIKLSKPKEFIGRQTKTSMLSGIIYGFAALTDDLTDRIKSKIGRKALVIGTGGNINLIGPYCKSMDRIDQDLTLKGLYLIFNSQ